jgi:hypothetical protein
MENGQPILESVAPVVDHGCEITLSRRFDNMVPVSPQRGATYLFLSLRSHARRAPLLNPFD